MELTDEQIRFVNSHNARILLEAPAGTGKTETVAARVASLVNAGEAPLLLCFTHSAERTLRARLDEEHIPVRVYTVVSYARSILADYYGEDFFHKWEIGDGSEIAARVTARTPVTASSLLSLSTLVREDAPLPVGTNVLAEELLETFRKEKLRAHYLDFLDVVIAATGLPPKEKFSEIIVDEAQDISPLQKAFLLSLGADRYVFAGDGFQSIFGFSGVDPESFRKLRKAGWKSFRLTHSFRVPANILKFITPLLPFSMTSERSGGSVSVLPVTGRNEAGEVAKRLCPGDVVLGLTRSAVARVAAAYDGDSCALWEDGDPIPGEAVFSTIHGAKGAGFARVFILGLDGSGLRDFHGDDPAALKRLLYVAATRAKEELVLCSYRDILPYGLEEVREDA